MQDAELLVFQWRSHQRRAALRLCGGAQGLQVGAWRAGLAARLPQLVLVLVVRAALAPRERLADGVQVVARGTH